MARRSARGRARVRRRGGGRADRLRGAGARRASSFSEVGGHDGGAPAQRGACGVAAGPRRGGRACGRSIALPAAAQGWRSMPTTAAGAAGRATRPGAGAAQIHNRGAVALPRRATSRRARCREVKRRVVERERRALAGAFEPARHRVTAFDIRRRERAQRPRYLSRAQVRKVAGLCCRVPRRQ